MIPSPSFTVAEGDDAINGIIAAVNTHLEDQGAAYRLDGVWMFTRGLGRPPNRILQRETRWVPRDPRRASWSTGTEDLTYVVDVSDLTTDEPALAVETALDGSFDTWSGVPNTFLDLVKTDDDGGNHDLLDEVPDDPFGACATSPFPSIVDPAAPILPNADIIVGGWLPREYFDCLVPNPTPPSGGDFILGVTWTFIFVDGAGNPTDVNNDGYVDTALKEIFYNERFDWVTTGSVFLSPGEDIESVAVHENGHAVDLGHFGGPPPNLRLHRNGRIFSPEAVMNPGYFGGEKRELLPTDRAGFATLWADGRGRR